MRPSIFEEKLSRILIDPIEKNDIEKLKSVLNISNPSEFINNTFALHYAVARARVECVQFLIKEKDANVNLNQHHQGTPLHVAAIHINQWDQVVHQSAQPKIMKILLKNGADRNLKNESGETPLDLVKEHGQDFRLTPEQKQDYKEMENLLLNYFVKEKYDCLKQP